MDWFNAIYTATDKQEGGYQAIKKDSGNYNSKGQLVGTNLGISAKAYEAYLKRPPTVQDMKAITPAIQKAVYRSLFYDPMQASKLISFGIAWLAFDSFIATGNLLLVKQAIKELKGKASTGYYALSNNDINIINAMEQLNFFKRLKLLNYKQRAKAAKSYGVNAASVLKNWNQRLDKIVYA